MEPAPGSAGTKPTVHTWQQYHERFFDKFDLVKSRNGQWTDHWIWALSGWPQAMSAMGVAKDAFRT